MSIFLKLPNNNFSRKTFIKIAVSNAVYQVGREYSRTSQKEIINFSICFSKRKIREPEIHYLHSPGLAK